MSARHGHQNRKNSANSDRAFAGRAARQAPNASVGVPNYGLGGPRGFRVGRCFAQTRESPGLAGPAFGESRVSEPLGGMWDLFAPQRAKRHDLRNRTS